MIVIDDLRAGLIDRATGRDLMLTPHMDALAGRGVKFTRAYAQYALCSPSRSSVLTGTRPDSTRVFDLTSHFRQFLPSVTTLPEQFKRHGYFTYGAGKVFHRGLGDDANSWSLPQPSVDRPAYALEEHLALDKARKEASRAEAGAASLSSTMKNGGGAMLPGVLRGGKVQRGPVMEVAPNNASFHDHAVADEVIAALRKAAPAARTAAGVFEAADYDCEDDKDYDGEHDNSIDGEGVKAQPFFIVAGFIRPHLPWVAPEKYWDMYEAVEEVEETVAAHQKEETAAVSGVGAAAAAAAGSTSGTSAAGRSSSLSASSLSASGEHHRTRVLVRAPSVLEASAGVGVPDFSLQGNGAHELEAYYHHGDGGDGDSDYHDGGDGGAIHDGRGQGGQQRQGQVTTQQQQQHPQQQHPRQPRVNNAATLRQAYAACASFVDGQVVSRLHG
jgi:hypothetical protein